MSPRGAPGLLDPAAQSERTLLAWTRTALAVTAVAAFLLRITADQQQAPLVATAVVLLLAGALLYAGGHRRYRRLLRDVPAGRAVTDRRLLALATAVALLGGIASAVSIAL
ncbi:DUF202 domain-containing protein [Pseudonocardia bannensis]|uniref:DUF202 domain-containing protein n=1 Tax=Pseudonocardia bannensis TaxID=630973 RepID=A0A848DQN1_9PSEU|nr:DUF202 domain-containing protein [Pseudonocardia bannensis]NMH95112.1 DUF202 domain-containing protein [Pseudonocardia bannensis]